MKDDIITNCHFGQRKLFWTEVEFLSLLAKKVRLQDVLVVYAGSAAGFHMPLIFELFPEVAWILIDPAKFKFKRELKHENKFVIINDFYSAESYRDILRINKDNFKRKHIAFVSDIRVTASDEGTFRDMVNQQLWTTQLNAVAYMHKFRLPYTGEAFSYGSYQYDTTDLKNTNVSPGKKEGILYLAGKLYLQLYPPNRSSESRLIGFRTPDQPFELAYYDAHAYDEQMNHFNLVDRCNTRFAFEKSADVRNHIAGFDEGYESACEYYLTWKYFQRYKGNVPSHPLVVRLLYYIDQKLEMYATRSLVECIPRTYKKREATANIIHAVVNDMMKAIKKQVAIIKEHGILTKEQYAHQKQKLNAIYNKYKELFSTD